MELGIYFLSKRGGNKLSLSVQEITELSRTMLKDGVKG